MEATEACTLTSRHVIVLLHYSLCCKYQYLFLIHQIFWRLFLDFSDFSAYSASSDYFAPHFRGGGQGRQWCRERMSSFGREKGL